jgi:inosose dehydratase
MTVSRRQFIFAFGGFTAGAAVPFVATGTSLETLLTLSAAAPAAIRFGYAAITWGGNDAQAIEEISALGFTGIQLRSNILKEYGERPKALRELLDRHKLEMVALSSGGVGIAAGTENDEIAKHASNAKFVHDVGGRYLQVTDSARRKNVKPEPSDFTRLGRLLTEIGKRAADVGIPLGYHNHMDSLGEAPDEVDRIMDAADSRYVKLELDIAHYQQGGGDPAAAIRKYHDRLLFLHIKDVETLSPPDERGRTYRWVELGRGRVDLPAVFAALKKHKFRGWAMIELDGVTDKSKTPKECAQISKKYVEEKLRLKI